jgi:hypothetical protein
MMSTRPPTVALWLLKRLLTGPNREALLGDLVEQRAGGRSTAWFWKETLIAIGTATAAEVRSHYWAVSAIAFFVGFASAAALGTIKTAPGLELFDAALAAFGAGWLVCRFGGPASALAFAAFVAVREVAPLYAAAMGFLDHFGGAWFITHHGMDALPSSWLTAAACIMAGAVCGARPPQDRTPAPSAVTH